MNKGKDDEAGTGFQHITVYVTGTNRALRGES